MNDIRKESDDAELSVRTKTAALRDMATTAVKSLALIQLKKPKEKRSSLKSGMELVFFNVNRTEGWEAVFLTLSMLLSRLSQRRSNSVSDEEKKSNGLMEKNLHEKEFFRPLKRF